MTQSTAVAQLMTMGYSEANASKALEVAGGDVEQAVGYLLMGEASQSGFDHEDTPRAASHSGGIASSLHIPVAAPTTSGAGRPGVFQVKRDPLNELMQMGYDRTQARQALSVSNGDVEQALNFLLMGESRTGFVLDLQSSFRFEDDAAMAAALQQDELHDGHAHAQQSESTLYHPTSLRANSNVPKMVASESFLTQPGAAPYCGCIAASKFLSGGVVTAEFLNEILEGGIELFRKGNSRELDVQEVIRKHGKRPLRIEAIEGEGEPKQGVFMTHDLQHELGLRKQLALCRNQQPVGWQLLILEIPGKETLCIALPPKGTKNKFWYLDFQPRGCFHITGAYARVHSSLLQLEESLEAIFAGLTKVAGKDFENYCIHMIKRRR